MRFWICLLTVISLGVQQTACCCAMPGGVPATCQHALGLECEHTESSQHTSETGRNPAAVNQAQIDRAHCLHAEHEDDERHCIDERGSQQDPSVPPLHGHHICVGTHVFYVVAKLLELPQHDLAPLFVSLEHIAVIHLAAIDEALARSSHKSPILLSRSTLGVYLI